MVGAEQLQRMVSQRNRETIYRPRRGLHYDDDNNNNNNDDDNNHNKKKWDVVSSVKNESNNSNLYFIICILYMRSQRFTKATI